MTALNPKSIALFVAFVPQFVDPSAPVLMQLVTLEITFVLLAAVNATVWAALASSARSRVVRPQTLTLVNRIGGSFLIGARLLTAALRKNGQVPEPGRATQSANVRFTAFGTPKR